jgi:isopentenyl-diphosphate delta-isomerase
MPNVILVDENDHQIGTMEKLAAHQDGGHLHRAISVIIFDPTYTHMLLQQRAAEKYHSPNLWTNTCCSHPMPGETVLESAMRRLPEEMNFQTDLHKIGTMLYRSEYDNSLTEHEYLHIFAGTISPDDLPDPNPDEAQAVRWITKEQLYTEVADDPESFTTWFRIMLKDKPEIFPWADTN